MDGDKDRLAGFLRFGFSNVFTLLGLAVPAGSWMVINAGIGVPPDDAVAVRGRRLWRGGSFGLAVRLERLFRRRQAEPLRAPMDAQIMNKGGGSQGNGSAQRV